MSPDSSNSSSSLEQHLTPQETQILSPRNLSMSHLSVAIATSDALVPINAHDQLPLQFNSSNYTSWKSQVRHLLFGYRLFGYLYGTSPCPDRGSTIDSITAHVHW